METKICTNCGIEMKKRKNESLSRYEKKQFCSYRCSKLHYYKQPNNLEACKKRNKELWLREDYRIKTSNAISDSLKKSEKNREHLKIISIMTPEKRLNISIARKGKLIGDNNPSKRPEVIEKIKKSLKGRVLGIRTLETYNKIGLFHRGKKKSAESKIKNSETHIILWQDKKYAEKMLKKFSIRPTSYEKKISELCIENNLPFIYTGDGTFLIGHKNPDFVNEKDKIAIEVYNNYFKIRDFGSCENYEKQRAEYFAKYGWKVIFIKSEEIEPKNWKEICLNKISLSP